MVGTTGTGKTTCLNIYTGQVIIVVIITMIMTGDNSDNNENNHPQNLETGDTAKSLTTHTVAVEDKIHGPGAPMWVDNPGDDNKQA